MANNSRKDAKDLRKAHNADLVRRMRNGENLTSFDSHASCFPPRPIIKKDSSEIKRLYSGEPNTNSIDITSALEAGEKVVLLKRRQERRGFEPMDDVS